MPQLRHQGKHVFGWSVIRKENTIHFPPDVINEYGLEEESDIILFTASKTSGGFCISKLESLKSSKLSGILDNNPDLESEENIGRIMGYKGKSYCHLRIMGENGIVLSPEIMNHFNVKSQDRLLIVRGSNIAFDCILKGPLVEVAESSDKEIRTY